MLPSCELYCIACPKAGPRIILQAQDRMSIPTVATMETDTDYRLLGHVEWDGAAAQSDRVFLKATVERGRRLTRNQYVRIRDEDGTRSGFLARLVAGPFFRGGPDSDPADEPYALAELELHGELAGGRSRATSARPMPGASLLGLPAAEAAEP